MTAVYGASSMWRWQGRCGSIVVSITAVCVGCGNPKEYHENVVPELEWSRLQVAQVVTTAAAQERTLSDGQLLRLPASYQLRPISPGVLAVTPDGCNLLVTDEADRAIHSFDVGLTHRAVLYAAPGQERWYRGIVSLAPTPSGDVLASYLGLSQVVALRSGVAEPIAWKRIADSVPAVRQITALSDSLFVDNWAASKRGTWSVDWAALSLPVLVLRNRAGKVVSSWGRFSPVGGVGLPSEVSRGHVLVFDRIVWFANALSGVVTPVWDVRGRPLPEGHVNDWRIAPMFVPERAREYVYNVDKRVFPLTQYAVEAVSTPTPEGGFLVVQASAWPSTSSRGIQFAPRLVIVPYLRRRRSREVWVTERPLRDATLFSGRVVTIEVDSVSGERILTHYPIPQPSVVDSLQTPMCSETE